jgi:hypothetical protein
MELKTPIVFLWGKESSLEAGSESGGAMEYF